MIIIITIIIIIIMMMMMIMIIIKSLFNVGHIHSQNFHYIAEANKNKPRSIIDIITYLFPGGCFLTLDIP